MELCFFGFKVVVTVEKIIQEPPPEYFIIMGGYIHEPTGLTTCPADVLESEPKAYFIPIGRGVWQYLTYLSSSDEEAFGAEAAIIASEFKPRQQAKKTGS